MKITVSIHRKEGRPNYGSDGAGCELTLDVSEATVSEHPDSLVDEIRRAYALAAQAVAEQLAKAQPEPQPQPPSRPDRSGYPSQARPESRPDVDPDYREPNRPAPRREQPPPRREPEPRQDYPDRQEQRRGADSGGHNGLPRTGRELYPWAKKQEENGCRGLIRAIKDLGGRQGYPEMLKDWDRQETREAIEVWRSLDPDRDREPARNGYHNGRN